MLENSWTGVLFWKINSCIDRGIFRLVVNHLWINLNIKLLSFILGDGVCTCSKCHCKNSYVSNRKSQKQWPDFLLFTYTKTWIWTCRKTGRGQIAARYKIQAHNILDIFIICNRYFIHEGSMVSNFQEVNFIDLICYNLDFFLYMMIFHRILVHDVFNYYFFLYGYNCNV